MKRDITNAPIRGKASVRTCALSVIKESNYETKTRLCQFCNSQNYLLQSTLKCSCSLKSDYHSYVGCRGACTESWRKQRPNLQCLRNEHRNFPHFNKASLYWKHSRCPCLGLLRISGRVCTVAGPISKQRWAHGRDRTVHMETTFVGSERQRGFCPPKIFHCLSQCLKPLEHGWFGLRWHSSGREWL